MYESEKKYDFPIDKIGNVLTILRMYPTRNLQDEIIV